MRSWRAAYRGVLSDQLLDGLSTAERTTAWQQLLLETGERQLVLVGEFPGGDLAGFCSIASPGRDEDADQGTAELGALYVDPDKWRVGVGSAILAAALADLGERGWRDVALWVLPENKGALAFYARFGFEVEKGVERREERSGKRVIRLRLWVP